MLIDLSTSWILILDILAWFFFHMSISLCMMRIPDEWFVRKHRLFKIAAWEKNGQLWNDIFHIQKWKSYLPDGSRIIKTAYNKTNLHGTTLESLEKFIIETKRAELTHWILILPAPIFLVWNPLWAGIVMIIYALGVNIPFILSQRYNRPRLERLCQRKLKREMLVG